MKVSYDGTDFLGSQRQGTKRTVQGELERAVEEVFGRPAPVYLAGRTDQGVHAVGQVASCADFRPKLEDEALAKALRACCPVDLSVTALRREPLGFHARYDAIWREYRYWLWCGSNQPLVRRNVWCAPRLRLKLPEMKEAATLLEGEHNFASLAAGGEGVPWSHKRDSGRGTVRTIQRCECEIRPNWWGGENGTLFGFRVIAEGFLPRMVRGIVGALVEIGRGQKPPQWIDELLKSEDRRRGPMNAPAFGLTLWNIGYGSDAPGDW